MCSIWPPSGWEGAFLAEAPSSSAKEEIIVLARKIGRMGRVIECARARASEGERERDVEGKIV